MPSYISMELSFYYHIFLGTSIAEFFVCCWSCLGCMSCTKLHWWCCGHLERLLRYCGIGISENLKSGCHCLTSTVTWLQKELLTERSLCKWQLGITNHLFNITHHWCISRDGLRHGSSGSGHRLQWHRGWRTCCSGKPALPGTHCLPDNQHLQKRIRNL